MSNQAGSTHRNQFALALAEKWLRRALGIVAVGFILLFLYTSLRRVAYPFSYDQVEGGTVTSVWRIAHGYPLYTKPTLDFVPFLYAPLYLYLAAGLSKVVGVGYASLRLLSILGTLGSLGVVSLLIHGETRSRLSALAGAGLYAACYHPLEAWFDMGRVDSLFVFLFLLAIYCTRRAPILLAVLVWLIAFQTKQTILPVAVLVLCADWQRPRRMALGLATFLAGIAASILFMNHLTAGWYSYYLFGTAKALPWILRPAVLYIPSDLLQPLGLAFLILLASLLCVPPTFRSRSAQFYLVVSFAIYASIWYLNLPSYAHGTETEPFQRRFLMVPVLRLAESSHALQKAAARYGVNVPQPEPMSPEKLVCIIVSLILLNAFGLWTVRASRNLSIRHWWLLWSLLLAILYASYAARYEQPLWYPYDIPHLVVFGIATVFLISDRPLPFVIAFAIDAPIRETSVFLIAVALFIHFRSKSWRIAIAACSALWILSRLIAQRLYPDGPHAWNGLHWYTMIKPWHLPQLFSIAGFLWLPVWLGVKYLNRRERMALYGATAMIFLTFFFATWNETRAWSEWSVLFAILAAVQLERSFAPPAHLSA